MSSYIGDVPAIIKDAGLDVATLIDMNREEIGKMIKNNQPSVEYALLCLDEIGRLSKQLLRKQDYVSLGHAFSKFSETMTLSRLKRENLFSDEFYEMSSRICHIFPINMDCLDMFISSNHEYNKKIINSINEKHLTVSKTSSFFEGSRLAINKLVSAGHFDCLNELLDKLRSLDYFGGEMSATYISVLQGLKPNGNNSEIIDFFTKNIIPKFGINKRIVLRDSSFKVGAADVMRSIIESNSIELGEFYLRVMSEKNFKAYEYTCMIDWHPGSRISKSAFEYHVGSFFDLSSGSRPDEDLSVDYLYTTISNIEDFDEVMSVFNGDRSDLIKKIPLNVINGCMEKLLSEPSERSDIALLLETMVDAGFGLASKEGRNWGKMISGLEYVDKYSKKSMDIKRYMISTDLDI